MSTKPHTLPEAAAKKARTLTVFDLLGVMFVGLKLTGHIDWSWWLVTLPMWGVYAGIIAFVGVLQCSLWIVQVWCSFMARRENAHNASPKSL